MKITKYISSSDILTVTLEHDNDGGNAQWNKITINYPNDDLVPLKENRCLEFYGRWELSEFINFIASLQKEEKTDE